MKKISILMFCMCMGFLGWSQNLPIVDFTGFNGSNLSTISPGWSEATGASLPGGTTSTWYSDNFTNTAGPNGTAATANLWLASKRDWIVSPSFLANVNSTLEFDLALTPYGGTATTTLGSDDSIAVKISTDGGLSFSILELWEGPGAVVSNTGQHQTYSLAGYAGTNLIVAIYVSEGTVDDAADNEVYIDNIEINNPIPVDLTVTQILSPVGSECYGTNETIQIEIQNVGTDPLDFGANSTIVQVGVLIPGPSFAIYPTVVPASVLAPGATMAVTVTNNGDFSTPGSYTIAASATFPGDPYAVNDTAVSTLFSIPTITPPFLEDFESGVAGSPGTFPFGWTTTAQTTYRWEVETDGTANSGGTGPIDDHTPGGTKYVFTEASNGLTGNIAELITPCIDLSTLAAPVLSFWYHMYGVNMSKLNIDIIAGGVTTPLDSIVGQQQTAEGDAWLADTLDLAAYVGQTVQIVFRGTRGSSFEGDLSLDDISVFEILANDISASNGSVTYSGCDGADSAVVSIDITNNGTNPATGIIAAFSVDGGPLTTPEFVPGILAPGAMITYTFTATADVSAPGPHTVAAGAAILTDQDTTNNVDIIAVFNSTLAAPFLEDFEGGTVGSPGVFPPGWSIASSSTASPASAGWHVESDGTTNSSDTGPLDDHTPGGTKYVFTETSSGSLGDVFELFSPCIDLDTVKAPKLSFWYHMYGATMGTLRVDAIAGGVRTALDSLVGQQQTGENEPWREMIIDLGAYEGQVIELVWVGTKGSSFTGDMAVDDINIFQPPASDLKVVGTNMGSSNCGLDSATVITVDVQNFGSDTIQSGSAQFSADAGTYTAAETIPGPIAPGAIVSYTFTATANFAGAGTHTLDVVATAATPADMDTSNDTLSQTLENVPLVALAFPWQETFESGPGIFTSGGANSTWELGTPAKDSIMGAASGAMAWVTNDSGFYNNNENSWVATACIDMTNAPANSWVSLKIWWESEAGWDGANLQSSVDGGSTWQLIGNFGDPNNWYNDNSIDGAPGGSLTGWAGRNGTGSGGYVLAAHPLPADLIGNPGVRLRVNFGSDGSVQDDGFAFDDFTISAPPAVDLGDSIVVCGTETLDAGYPGSTYVWSTGDVSQTITLVNTTAFNIIDSMIYVTVTDTFGLVGTDSVRVSIPATLPTVTASVTADVLCNGDSTGSALAVLNGGTAPITYLWSTNPAQNSEIASMLPAGTYTITVIDSFGCETQDSVTISEPPAIFGVIDSIADASCYGDSTGAIYLTIMGGVPGYTYAWSNGATTEDITGVPAGDYFISVTDANGCVTPPNIPISVGQPDSLAVTLDQITDNQCADDSTGAIDITVSGGTMPYSFLWDNGATTEDLTGLPNGSYTGTITDANGCELVSPALAVANTDSLPEGSFAYMPVGGVNYNVDFSSSSPNATSYAWDFGDSNTSTDPNPSHSYATNNDYVVSLTITNDCGSVTITDTVSVTQVGIEDNLLSQNVKIYPNPNQGIFEVNFDRLDLEDVTIQVYSMEGRRVYSQEIGTIRGLYSHQVNLPENIAKGVYMLHINTAKANLRKRFLLN